MATRRAALAQPRSAIVVHGHGSCVVGERGSHLRAHTAKPAQIAEQLILGVASKTWTHLYVQAADVEPSFSASGSALVHGPRPTRRLVARSNSQPRPAARGNFDLDD